MRDSRSTNFFRFQSKSKSSVGYLVNITSAFLGLILAFLVIPIFSLTLDTPLFYVNRGVKIPAAVLLLLGALVAFWLIFFLFFYLVSSFLARIIQPNQLGRLFIFVEVLYLTF